MVTNENLLICSMLWGDNKNSKNGFYPFELQYLDNGLNYKVFRYDREIEIEKEFYNRYSDMGEYIYYKIYRFLDSIREEIKINGWEYILIMDYNDTLFIGDKEILLDKLNILKLQSKTILGSEKNQFPFKVTTDNWPLDIDFGSGPYLNSGIIFSKSDNLIEILEAGKKMCEEQYIPYISDQGVWQILYKSNNYSITLDEKNLVFYNTCNTTGGIDYNIENYQLVSKDSKPIIIHQNGLWDGKSGLISDFGEKYRHNSYFSDEMIEKFNKLSSEGFIPKTILDIGAWRGKWSRSFLQIFPTCKPILFEANPINKKWLDSSNLVYFNDLLWRYSGVKKTFYTLKDELSDINTGSSIYIENTPVYNEDSTVSMTIETKTLDSIINYNKLSDINFIKIDTQGSELDIFYGASDLFKNNFIDFILMELPIKEYNKGTPDFYGYLKYMESMDFYPYDIFELHQWENRTLQMDILFVNKYSSFYKNVRS